MKYHHLSSEERFCIEKMYYANSAIRRIAEFLFPVVLLALYKRRHAISKNGKLLSCILQDQFKNQSLLYKNVAQRQALCHMREKVASSPKGKRNCHTSPNVRSAAVTIEPAEPGLSSAHIPATVRNIQATGQPIIWEPCPGFP